jgi:hypothetical protein
MSNAADPMKEARMPLPMEPGATAFCSSSLIFANKWRVAPTLSVASGNSALRRGGHD